MAHVEVAGDGALLSALNEVPGESTLGNEKVVQATGKEEVIPDQPTPVDRHDALSVTDSGDSTQTYPSVPANEHLSFDKSSSVVPEITDKGSSEPCVKEINLQNISSISEVNLDKTVKNTGNSVAPCGTPEPALEKAVKKPGNSVAPCGTPELASAKEDSHDLKCVAGAESESKKGKTGDGEGRCETLETEPTERDSDCLKENPLEDKPECDKTPEMSTSAKRKKGRPVKYGRHGKDGEESALSKALLAGTRAGESEKLGSLGHKNRTPSIRGQRPVRKSGTDTDSSDEEYVESLEEAESESDVAESVKEEGASGSGAPSLTPRQGGRVRKRPAIYEDTVSGDEKLQNVGKKSKKRDSEKDLDIDEEPKDSALVELEEVIKNIELEAKEHKICIVACPKCNKEYNRTYIKQHILTKHGPKNNARPFECLECEKKFQTKGSLNYHMNIHMTKKPYECDVCGQNFTQKGNMVAHKHIHDRQDGVKDYKCEDCGKQFNSKRYWEGHLKFHAGEYNFVCDICNRAFLQKDGLKSHMKTHSNIKPFVCDVCGEGLSSIGALKNHKLIHTGEKPFECSVCKKCFRNKTTYIRHLTVHSDERPYKCDICGLSFKWPLYLLRHKVIHTDEKKFQCSDCDKSFKRREHLKLHERTHTGEKPFVCEYCAKKFSQSCSLRQHEKIHLKKNHSKLSTEELEKINSHSHNVTLPAESMCTDGMFVDDCPSPSRPRANILKRKGLKGGRGKALLMTKQVLEDNSYYENVEEKEDSDEDSSSSTRSSDNESGVDSDGARSSEDGEDQAAVTGNVSESFVSGQINQTTWATAANPDEVLVSSQAICETENQSALVMGTSSSSTAPQEVVENEMVYNEVVIPSNASEVEICATEEVVTQNRSPTKIVLQNAQTATFGNGERLIYLLIDSESGPMPVVLDKTDIQRQGISADSNITFVIAGDAPAETESIIIEQPESKLQTFPESALEGIPIQTTNIGTVEQTLPMVTASLENVINTLTSYTVPNDNAVAEKWAEISAAVAMVESAISQPSSNEPCTEFLASNHSAVQVEPAQPAASPYSMKSETMDTNMTRIVIKDEVVEVQEQETSNPQTSFQSEFEATIKSSADLNIGIVCQDNLVDSKSITTTIIPASVSGYPLLSVSESEFASGEANIAVVADESRATPISEVEFDHPSPCGPEHLEPKSEVLDLEENDEKLVKTTKSVTVALDIAEEKSKLEAAQSLARMMNEPGPCTTLSLDTLVKASDLSDSKEFTDIKDKEAGVEPSGSKPEPGPSRKKSLRSWIEPKRKYAARQKSKNKPQYTQVKDGVDCDLNTGECFSCKKIFRNKSYLRHHILMHKGIKSKFCCHVCNRTFSCATNLKTHIAIHFPESRKNFLCSTCGLAMTSKATLQGHMRIHTRKDGEKDFKCEICGKGFNSRVHFTGHMKMHKGMYNSVCQVCGRPFPTSHALKMHMKSHSDLKNFICDVCGKAVKSSTALKNHKRIHTDDRPHKCSICNRAFRDRSTMLRHEVIHSEERPYVCDICGLGFKWKLYLTRHKIVHTSIADYECPTCQKRFKRKEHLKLHLRVHTGEKPYQCRFCDQKFTQTSSCRIHEKTHMKGQVLI
jgi:uncharacterized Zn-finger protein